MHLSIVVDPRRIFHETPHFVRSCLATPYSILPKVMQATFFTCPLKSKQPDKKSGCFDLVDFDTVFLNRLATELNYLVWVLKGDYK